MASVDVKSQVAARFAAPLDAGATRRIVLWHDPEGEFEQLFEEIAEEGFGEAGDKLGRLGEPGAHDAAEGSDTCGAHPRFPRPVRCVEAKDGAMFAVKKLIARDDVTSDLLVYRRRARGNLEGDWLADAEMYAESFQADYLSLLAEQLHAADTSEVREALSEFKAFFAAKDRAARFSKCMPAPQTAADVRRGVMAALLGTADATPVGLVVAFLEGLQEGAEPYAALEKYGAAELFARLVERVTGYAGDLSELRGLATHVLLTAFAAEADAAWLHGLEGFVSSAHAPFCLNVVRAWESRQDEGACGGLYELARTVEEGCKLSSRLEGVPTAELARCEVFPCVDEVLLRDLMASMAQGARRFEEIQRVVRTRRTVRWYQRVAPYYDLLFAAAEMQAFYYEHPQGFHMGKPREVWDAYVESWHLMDTAFRHFGCALNRCTRDANPLLEGEAAALADWADRLYGNWYLAESTACWTNAAASPWRDGGYVEGVPQQRRFFLDVVEPELAGAKHVWVIVSDALRFDVAGELAGRLEAETRGQVRLDAMQAVFPSVTEFGMAALLPQAKLSYRDGQEGALGADTADAEAGTSGASGHLRGVFADGMPTATTEQRQAVLRERKPHARALRASDLLNMHPDERKQLARDVDVLYVYHNKIDATGEDLSTEGEVFDACSRAVEDVCALVKRAVSSGVTRVLITADHGFIYTRRPLREFERMSKDAVEGTCVEAGRRYVIAQEGATSDALVRVDMSDLGPYVGFAPRTNERIKRPGAGERYVHGGTSLQELCVPVVRFRDVKAGAKGFVERSFTTLQLLDGNRRITNTLFSLDFYQTEQVAGKIAACEYDLSLVDGQGQDVTDVRRVRADLTAQDNRARTVRVSFALKAGRTWKADESYSLLARRVVDGKPTGEVDVLGSFTVEIAFAPDDFGF